MDAERPAGRKGDAGKDAEVIAAARARFNRAATASFENRRAYTEDSWFSATEDQWPEEVKRLRGAHRPAMTFNRLNTIVKQIVGDYRQNKLAIKVLPADGDASGDVADMLAGIIRNIEARSNADVAYANALECAARGGFGYFRIVPEYAGDDTFDQDLWVRPIHNPLTVYFDPAARLITREDAEWCFVTEMVPREQFDRLYPGADADSFEGAGDGYAADWAENDQVRVAEYFSKERYSARLVAFSNGMVIEADDEEVAAMARIGVSVVRERQAERVKVVWRKMTGGQVLETREYRTRYIPVIPVIGEEVNLEGKVLTRSAIYYAKDAQRMYNYWKNAATETVALAPKTPWLVTPEQIQNFEDVWANANTTPLPYLPYNETGGAVPQRVPPVPQPVGELAMGLNAGDDIKATTGIYDASLGARSNETSGRAIVARQQQGATVTYLFIDNLKQAIEHCGRVLIDWLPVYYDTERVARLLDPEGNPRTETINQRVRDPLTGITRVLNSVNVGKYDVVVEAGPSFANRKAEALQWMTQMAQAYPPLMQLAGDLVLKNIDAPGAEQMAERLKKALPPGLVDDEEIPGQPQIPPEVLAQQAEAQRQQQEAAQKLAVQEAEFRAKKETEDRKFLLEEEKMIREFEMKQRQMAAEAVLRKRELEIERGMQREKMLGELALKQQQMAQEEALKQRRTEMEMEADRRRLATELALKQAGHLMALRDAAPPVAQIEIETGQESGHGDEQESEMKQMAAAILQLAEQNSAALQQTMQVTAGVGQAMQSLAQQTAEGTQALAGGVLRQAEVTERALAQNTQVVKEVAQAISEQNRIALAPRKAVRDKQGNIVAAEVDL